MAILLYVFTTTNCHWLTICCLFIAVCLLQILNSPSNYRGISLIPVIAKVFENVILSLCDDALVTSELQFGFKKNTGCSDAIFALGLRT